MKINIEKFKLNKEQIFILAESEGFEPSIQLPVYLLSREALSTTQPTLRVFYYTDNFIMLNDSNYRILVYDQNSKTQKIALL